MAGQQARTADLLLVRRILLDSRNRFPTMTAAWEDRPEEREHFRFLQELAGSSNDKLKAPSTRRPTVLKPHAAFIQRFTLSVMEL